jgi:hypothetical protein
MIEILRSGKREVIEGCYNMGFSLYEGEDGSFLISSDKLSYQAKTFYKLKEFLANNIELLGAIQNTPNANDLHIHFDEDFGKPDRKISGFDDLQTNQAWIGIYPNKFFSELPAQDLRMTTMASISDVVELVNSAYGNRGFAGMTRQDFDDMDASMDAFWHLYRSK